MTLSHNVSMWITHTWTMLVCGDLVSNQGVRPKKHPDSLFLKHIRIFRTGVNDPAFCGKKTLAIGPITRFIIKNIVQRTYAEFNGMYITVIPVCCEFTNRSVRKYTFLQGATPLIPGSPSRTLSTHCKQP